jgi:hypothetical protein
MTPSPTPTSTLTRTVTPTASQTTTPTPSITPTGTLTVLPTATPTTTGTPTFTPTPTVSPTITLTPTATQIPGEIRGMVFIDLNRNGYPDTGEAGLAGAVIELRQGSLRLDQRITSSSGTYTFSGLVPGYYTVKEIDPFGYASTSDNEIPNVLVMSGYPPVELNFGDYPTPTTPIAIYLPLARK